MNKTVRAIVNADDFGMSASVNEAVQEACEYGVLTSATIMANMPGFDEAVRISLKTPQLGVGVHLNLLRGAPIIEPRFILGLVGNDGKFLENAGKLWYRFALDQVNEKVVDLELSAQIARVKDAGIEPTHVDSEKHLHILIPELGRIICRVAKRHGIECIRIIREPMWMLEGVRRPPIVQFAKLAFINRNSKKLSQMATACGLHFVDHFYGFSMSGMMEPQVYCALLRRALPGVMEIMCHPAVSPMASSGVRTPSWLDRYRRREYRALLDPATREAFTLENVELIHYGKLNDEAMTAGVNR